MANTSLHGTYLPREGKKGDAAWGTRGRWCNLSGLVGDEPVTITILDHPANPGFPTYWHARGYGLFAANPLGQKVFSNGKEELAFSLTPNASATFRYRILISSAIATPEATEAAYKAKFSFSPSAANLRPKRDCHPESATVFVATEGSQRVTYGAHTVSFGKNHNPNYPFFLVRT
jgi:hypothetical protein